MHLTTSNERQCTHRIYLSQGVPINFLQLLLKKIYPERCQKKKHQKLPGRVVLSKPVPRLFFGGGFKFQASWKMSRSSKKVSPCPIFWMNTTNAPQTTVFCPLFLGGPPGELPTKMLVSPPPKDMSTHISSSLIFRVPKSSPVREGNSPWKFPALWLLRQRNWTSLNSKGNQKSLHL